MKRVVLITGASQGIGAAMSKRFGSRGDRVVANYFHSRDRAKKIVDSLEEAMMIKADVANRNSVNKMVKKIFNKWGKIDVLINNAGKVFEPAGWEKVSQKSFIKTIETNLAGVFNCLREVGLVMLKQKHGKIINIASTAGIQGVVQAPAYGAAKAGVINLTKAFAKELAPNVLVNAISPGFVLTDWHKKKDQELLKKIKEQIPLKRMARIKEVVDLTVYLSSSQSGYITGQNLVIDGGLS